ncbi:MAG: YfcE family phosphodiesterase [Nitrososphaeraceae archaeon]|nr:YfcE family phosphodiesterase [Nitrososphaeraceae archaeon]
MRIGVISDSHDDIINVKQAIKIFNEYEVDYVIHAGDYIFPGIVLEFKNLHKNIKFVGVFGNNDGEKIGLVKSFITIAGDLKGDFGELKLDDEIFGIYHGTNEDIKSSLIRANYYDVLICGHTHKKDNNIINRTQILNPGSSHRNLQNDELNKKASVIIYYTGIKKYEFIELR